MRSSRSKTQELCNVRTNSNENSYPRSAVLPNFLSYQKTFFEKQIIYLPNYLIYINLYLILHISHQMKLGLHLKLLTGKLRNKINFQKQ